MDVRAAAAVLGPLLQPHPRDIGEGDRAQRAMRCLALMCQIVPRLCPPGGAVPPGWAKCGRPRPPRPSCDGDQRDDVLGGLPPGDPPRFISFRFVIDYAPYCSHALRPWIGDLRAAEALERLETLLAWPAMQRKPNLLVIGPTNTGKSMIVEKSATTRRYRARTTRRFPCRGT